LRKKRGVKNEKYLYKSEDKFEFFEFYSQGTKGVIKKVIEYQPTSEPNIYNLAFGDFDEKTNQINDMTVTNNGDSLKVLATVASTIYAFIEKHPNSWIVATGSTDARTRLYRMGITNNLVEISKDFYIFGYTKAEVWEEFVVGNDYDAFLVTKK